MGMGILEAQAAMPDTMGLPEYRVTEVYTEIDGNDVRMAFGTKRFGHVEWLYTVVVDPWKLLEFCRHCETVAIEAINLSRLIGNHSRDH